MNANRTEIVCPACKQMNLRYSGWREIFNPRWPQRCTLCHVELKTGKKDALAHVYGPLMFFSVYLIHALVVGAGVLIVTLLALPWLLSKPLWVRVSPFFLGAALGIGLAQWSLPRGGLPDKSQGEPKSSIAES